MVIQPAVTVAKTHVDIQKTTTSHWSSSPPHPPQFHAAPTWWSSGSHLRTGNIFFDQLCRCRQL